MIGMGGATKYSIFKSQNNFKKANNIFTQAFFLVVTMAAIYFLIGILFSGPLAKLLGATKSVYDMSSVYLRVILVFAPMFMMNNLLLCYVRNDGAPQLSMMAMLGGSFSNIVLDYVFMFPLDMGIFGAAFATGLAPVISILILSPFFIRKLNSFLSSFCLNLGMSCFVMPINGGDPDYVILSKKIVIRLMGIMLSLKIVATFTQIPLLKHIQSKI